jgi:hypothetical protein
MTSKMYSPITTKLYCLFKFPKAKSTDVIVRRTIQCDFRYYTEKVPSQAHFKLKCSKICKISGSHGDEHEGDCLLGGCAL